MSQSEEAPWVKIARSQDWDTLNVLLKRTEAESVQKLIKGNEMGRTALSYALRKGAPEEIVMTMLDLVSGREGRSFLGSRDRFMFTALHHAAGFCSNIKILKKLVDLYPEALLMTTISGSTPLMLVMTYGKDKRNYKERISLLGDSTYKYRGYLCQIQLALCCHRFWVVKSTYDPFVRTSKFVKMDNDSFYVMSVLGFFLQREMKGLADLIISFVGVEGGRPRSCSAGVLQLFQKQRSSKVGCIQM
ncbi:hypothetical protein TrST_g12543 [Triparma strigata]|uniref:Uncharacterized protein n=1 Tax=Triparma strigata TaxID=1606541 RepID=A0A9W7B1T2_9STRA|nr:hypothetical protein TrST_g12543 [Triparma strigata]